MNIVILDGYTVLLGSLVWQQLSELPDVKVEAYERTDASEVVSRSKDADAILTNKVAMSCEVLAQLPRLRYIGVLATGYNVVDLQAARERGIVVTNIPAYSTASVAQQVFAHILNVTNQVAYYAEANRKGRWAKSCDFMWADTHLTELKGLTLAIRGMGNIGMQVARIALAMDMRVLAVSNRKDLPDGVDRCSWETALREADILSLHCPLTDETHEMINRTTLKLMKPTAILINTGRGPLVSDADVADALRENRLGAYCADVITKEPPSEGNLLFNAPRCYITPHIAWATEAARRRLIDIATKNIEAFIQGHPVNVVS